MTIFNQQGQNVQNQYNAGGNIHIDAIRDKQDLEKRLELLTLMVEKAIAEGTIDMATGEVVNKELQKASSGGKKAVIVKHLSKVKEFLKGAKEVGGIVSAVEGLIKLIYNWIV